MRTVQEFDEIYNKFNDARPSIIPLGLTYEQLLAAWGAAGRPEDIEGFLVHGATEDAVNLRQHAVNNRTESRAAS